MTEAHIGKPQKEIPERQYGHTHHRTSFWEAVRREVDKHPGKWVPVNPGGRATPYSVQDNITAGRIKPMRGTQATVRNKQLYVKAPTE